MNHGDDYWWQPGRKVLVVEGCEYLAQGDVRTIAASTKCGHSYLVGDVDGAWAKFRFRPIAFRGDKIPVGARVRMIGSELAQVKDLFHKVEAGTIWTKGEYKYPMVILSFPCPKCGKQDCRDGEQIGSIGGVKIVVDCGAEVVRCPAGVDERLLEAGS